MNRAFLILFLIFSSQILAQDSRVKISGLVLNDTLRIENVHVINKSTQMGTLTNAKGQFKINASVKDTLMFSNIQFENKIVIITQENLITKYILIKLDELTNELDEVIVKQYDDVSEELGLPNAGKKPLNKLERNLNHYSQKSTPVVILQALFFKPGGIDDVYNIISGNRKRDRKLKALIDADRQNETDLLAIDNMRTHFGDEFFVNTIGLEQDEINNYIHFCFSEGIVKLYNDGRLIEVIDIFLKNKEAFLETFYEDVD